MTGKRSIAILLLCVALVLSVITGCQTSNGQGDTTQSTTTTTTQQNATDPTGNVTVPSGDITDPTGDATVPSGDATVPSGDATEPTGDATEPSGNNTTAPSGDNITATTAPQSDNGTTKTTKTTAKTEGNTTINTSKVPTVTSHNGKDETVKVGNLTVHSAATPYVTGGELSLTVMLPYSSENGDMTKQAFAATYQKRSGIKVTYQIYAHSDIFVLKSTMLNSGSVPDIFIASVGFDVAEATKYGGQGFFADLTDKLPVWAPNVYEKMHSGKYPQAKNTAYGPGKVYALPQLLSLRGESGFSYMTEFQPMINTAWLDELGLDVPTTTQELYEVCKAFTEEDPDGNGKNDTYGFGATRLGAQMWNPWGLGMSYYVHGAITEKGEVVSAPLTDQFRDGCRFYNRMWEEGLMAKQMFGASSAAIKSLIAKTGIMACGSIAGYVSESELKNWKAISWPKAPNTGDFKSGIAEPTRVDSWAGAFVIGSKTASVEACLRWLDYFYTPDGAMLWSYGPEKVAYDKIGNNYKLKKNSSELSKNQKILCSISPMSTVNVLEKNSGEMTAKEKQTSRFNAEAKAANVYSTYPFDALESLATAAEQEAIGKLKAPGDVNWGFLAIRGEVDIETDWNSYKNMYSADYAKWKALYQGIFNRVYK